VFSFSSCEKNKFCLVKSYLLDEAWSLCPLCVAPPGGFAGVPPTFVHVDRAVGPAGSVSWPGPELNPGKPVRGGETL
jgi:hypothetical protein